MLCSVTKAVFLSSSAAFSATETTYQGFTAAFFDRSSNFSSTNFTMTCSTFKGAHLRQRALLSSMYFFFAHPPQVLLVHY